MTVRIQFTQKSLDALPVAAKGKRTVARDEEVKGLIVEITSTGARTFYMYRWHDGRPRRLRLGPYPSMTIAQARIEARALVVKMDTGEDPDATTPTRKMTLGQLFDWWEEHHGPRRKTVEADRKQFDIHFAAMSGRALADITRSDMRATHAAIAKRGPVTANRCISLIRTVYNRAIADEVYDGGNPAAHIKAFPEQSRDRRLTLAEATRLFVALEATDSQALRDLVYLLLFTGARKSNVMAMRWDQLDLVEAVWVIPASKNGKPVAIPLLADEMLILRRRREGSKGPWVFPGRAGGATGHFVEPKNGWKVLLARAEIGDLHIHDLRRSLGSFMADSGASLQMIGKALGHKSQAATAIYARLSLEPVKEAKRKALEAMRHG